MSTNKLMFVALLCIWLLAGQAAASNVVLMPGPSGSNATVNVYGGDPLASVGSLSASPQSFQAVANAAGSRYYILSKASTSTLVVADSAMTVLQRLDLGSGAAAMALSPDGRRLIVLAGQLRVYDATGSNLADITPSPVPDVGSNPVDVAISPDSSRAFVLSSATRKLTVLNLSTLAVLGSVSVPGISTGVAVAPTGLLYVSAQNRIYEVDGRAITVKGQIAINGQPGKLAFTPDGKHALAPNQTPLTGKAVWYFNLTNLSEEDFFSNFGDTVDKIVVTSNSKAFGFSASSGRLFVIPLSPFNMDEATFSNLPGSGKFSGVTTITASDELPQAKFMYVATSAVSLVRVNLATNLVQGQASPSAAAAASAFAGPAATGVPAAVLKYNDNLPVDTGKTSQPLVVRVLNSAGRPMAGVPVTFSTTAPGATIQGAIATTNANGFAQASVVAPGTPGQVTVNVDIGGGAVTTSFLVLVGGGGVPGGPGGLTIVSGNGQVVRQNFQSTEPLKIKLVDPTTGNPISGVVVTFAVKTGIATLTLGPDGTAGGGPASGLQVNVKTSVKGLASVNFVATAMLSGKSYEQATVTATRGSGSVTFTETTTLNLLAGGGFAPDPTVTLITPPSSNRKIVAKAGQTVPAAIEVSVVVTAGPQAGQPMPGVGVKATTGNDPALAPTAECAGGTVLTDATGIGVCDLLAGGHIGDAILTVKVGSFNNQPGIQLKVLPGDPSAIQILLGNNQSGKPGDRLPIALTAKISDAGGNPLPGTPAQWEVVNPGSVTLSSTTSVADASAQVATIATLGSIAGPAQVRVRSGTASAVFTLTVVIPVTGIQVVDGNGQTALLNAAFAKALVVKAVDAQGNPVAGIPVAFIVLSGSASLGAASATTDLQGLASTTVTAGSTAGPIAVQAGSGDFSATFNLTAIPPGPVVTLAGVRNSISGELGVTPGGIIAIYGAGLAGGINGSVVGWNMVGPLPTKLADVEVLFGASQAPIYSVNNINGQQWVVVQAPFELTAPGTVAVTVNVAGGNTVVHDVPVRVYQPGIFESLGPNGERYAVLMKEDGSYVSPTNAATRPSTLRMFAGGLGQTAPASGTNRAGVPGQTALAKVVVGVNNAGVKVVSAETMVGAVGVYIVTFEVPAGTATGLDRPFAIAIRPGDGGSLVFGNPSTIAIQ